jgi:dipeptidyl aminopeptidase/acylaminoacyl peptidase
MQGSVRHRREHPDPETEVGDERQHGLHPTYRLAVGALALILAGAGTLFAYRAFRGEERRSAAAPSPISWVRNGKIALVREEPGAPGAEPKLLALSTHGAEARHLATGVEHPSWSPGGTEIAVDSTDAGGTEVLILDADGKLLNQVTRSPSDGATITNSRPAWSPDGTRVAHVRTEGGPPGDIHVIGADGKDPVRLTGPEGDDADPAWSPGATRIAFRSYRASGAGIYAVDTDVGDEVGLATGWEDVGDPSWSPDGEWIVFAGYREDNFDIYSVATDGSGLTNLTQFPSNETEPTWSPDGTKITFVSDRDGDGEIFVMNADGTAVTQLTHNDVQDYQPAWQPVLMDRPEATSLPSVEARVQATIQLGDVPTLAGEIAVGEGAVWAQVSEDARRSRGSHTVVRIDPQSGEVMTAIPVTGAAWGLAAGAGGVWAAIPSYDEPRAAATGGVVQRIDPATDRVVATIPVGPYPEAIAVASGSVWAVAGDASEDFQQLFRIDPGSNQVTSSMPLPGLTDGYIDDMAVASGDVWLLQHQSRPGSDAEHNGYVVRVDGQTGRVRQVIPAEGINMAEGRDRIVITGRVEKRGGWPHAFVARTLDAATGRFLGPPIMLETGVSPIAISSEGVWAIETTGRFGWLHLSRLDPATLDVVDRHAVLETSIYTDILWDPAARTIWAATVLDGSGVLVRIGIE